MMRRALMLCLFAACAMLAIVVAGLGPRCVAVSDAREAAEPGRQGHRPRRVSRQARARHDVLRKLSGDLSADHRHAARGRAQARRAASASNCACCSCPSMPSATRRRRCARSPMNAASTPSRWTLAHADAAAVRRIAAALSIQYRQLPDGQFSHSTIISALAVGRKDRGAERGAGPRRSRAAEGGQRALSGCGSDGDVVGDFVGELPPVDQAHAIGPERISILMPASACRVLRPVLLRGSRCSTAFF